MHIDIVFDSLLGLHKAGIAKRDAFLMLCLGRRTLMLVPELQFVRVAVEAKAWNGLGIPWIVVFAIIGSWIGGWNPQ